MINQGEYSRLPKFPSDPLTDPRQAEALREKSRNMPAHLKPLERTLLALGGSFAVVRPNEQDHLALVESSHVLDGAFVRSEPGEPNECHANAARAFAADPAGVAAWTGYALSRDGIWRQHSWFSRGPLAFETTEPRVAYCGIRLEGTRALAFALGQLPLGECVALLERIGAPEAEIAKFVAAKEGRA